jgi:hypothetical protein
MNEVVRRPQNNFGLGIDCFSKAKKYHHKNPNITGVPSMRRVERVRRSFHLQHNNEDSGDSDK